MLVDAGSNLGLVLLRRTHKYAPPRAGCPSHEFRFSVTSNLRDIVQQMLPWIDCELHSCLHDSELNWRGSSRPLKSTIAGDCAAAVILLSSEREDYPISVDTGPVASSTARLTRQTPRNLPSINSCRAQIAFQPLSECPLIP